MGKVNSDSMKKVWEKRTFQSQGFLHILREAEIQRVPKPWEKWTLVVQEKYIWENTNIQNLCYEFLKYFA